MAQRYQLANGIIINRRSLPNGDVLISLFNQKGKMRAIAKKGKSLGGNIARMSLFNDIKVQYYQKDADQLAILTQVELSGSLEKLSRPEIYPYAHILAELVDKLSQDDLSEPKMYSYLASGLRGLSEFNDAEKISIIYAWKIIQQAGLAPRLQRCSICGSTDLGNKFNLHSGGITCKTCNSGIFISTETLEYLQKIHNHTVRAMLEHNLSKAQEHWKLIKLYSNYHIAEIKSIASMERMR